MPAAKIAEVEDELGDVAIYLVRLTDTLGIDLHAQGAGPQPTYGEERSPAASRLFHGLIRATLPLGRVSTCDEAQGGPYAGPQTHSEPSRGQGMAV